MVKYTCDLCDKIYGSFEEAKNCEDGGLIGPIFEPGLLFTHKQTEDGFLVFYQEQNSDNHDRIYFMEEIYRWSSDHISGLGCTSIKGSNFEECLESYRISTDDEVISLKNQLSNGVMGISGVKAYFEKFGIKKLHNNFNLEKYLSKK